MYSYPYCIIHVFNFIIIKYNSTFKSMKKSPKVQKWQHKKFNKNLLQKAKEDEALGETSEFLDGIKHALSQVALKYSRTASATQLTCRDGLQRKCTSTNSGFKIIMQSTAGQAIKRDLSQQLSKTNTDNNNNNNSK